MQQQPSPYDFIVNNGSAQKQPGLPGSNSMATRIVIFAGGLMLLVLILIIGASLLGGGGGSRDSLLATAQSQQETVRVATLIAKDSNSQTVKNVAISTQLSVTSDQQQLTTVLGTAGVSFNEEELALGTNPETDSKLETAKSAGLYETTALGILSAQVETYQGALGAAYESTKNESIRQALSDEYNAAKVLLEELKTVQP